MSDAQGDASGLLTRFERDREGALMMVFDPAPAAHAFEAMAFDLVRRIGATIADRIDTPDARLWRLVLPDAQLTLLHAEAPGTFLIAYDTADEPALRRVRALLESIAARIQGPEPLRPEED